MLRAVEPPIFGRRYMVNCKLWPLEESPSKFFELILRAVL
jgi:hypothetical protein